PFTVVAEHLRPGIPRAPVEKIQFRIVAATHPGGAAAGLPSIGSARPGLAALFARRGNRVKTPGAFAGGRVVRIDKAADAILAAAHPDDYAVFDDQRRRRRRVGLLVILDHRIPQDGAGPT